MGWRKFLQHNQFIILNPTPPIHQQGITNIKKNNHHGTKITEKGTYGADDIVRSKKESPMKLCKKTSPLNHAAELGNAFTYLGFTG